MWLGLQVVSYFNHYDNTYPKPAIFNHRIYTIDVARRATSEKSQ
jgi:hypothetical protein